MQKKYYIAPEAEIEAFTIQDVVTQSAGIGDGGNEGGDLDAVIDSVLIKGEEYIYLDENGDVIDQNDLDSIF